MKVRGIDERGDFRIGQRSDQVELQYTVGEVDLAARQLKESTTKKSLDWPKYQTWWLQLQCKL